MKGNRVAGVVVATPLGRGVVLADVVTDSTGNADIAAAAGADTQYSISATCDLSVQVAGYPDRGLGQRANNTAYAMVNDNDVFDRWHLLLSARKAGGRSMENPYDMGQLVDTRDRRRVAGNVATRRLELFPEGPRFSDRQLTVVISISPWESFQPPCELGFAVFPVGRTT